MKKKRTSSYHFAASPMDVWLIVTKGTKQQDDRIKNLSEEEYAESKQTLLSQGKYLAKITEMEPGLSCAYDLEANNFIIHWRATFETEKNGGCLMTITETYDFPAKSWFSAIIAKLFLKQEQQHLAYFQQLKQGLNNRGV